MTNREPRSNDPTSLTRVLSFRLGTLFLLTALIAVGIAWFLDRNSNPKNPYDVIGPLTIKYEYRLNDRSTPNRTISGVLGMRFGNGIIIADTANGGVIIPTANLIEFDWVPE